jgi:hypothetical protein
MKDSDFVKIRVFVPVSHADALRAAMGRVGAGKMGNYEYCSSSWAVTGRFFPMSGAQPAIGEIGTMEEVPEEVVETICHKDIIKIVIAEIKKVHPYEEPAIDIMPRFDIE